MLQLEELMFSFATRPRNTMDGNLAFTVTHADVTDPLYSVHQGHGDLIEIPESTARKVAGRTIGGMETYEQVNERTWRFKFNRTPNFTQLAMFLETCIAEPQVTATMEDDETA